MKKSTFLLIVFLAFAGMANAQKPELVGSWLMTKAEVDGKVETPYFITEFKDDGIFMVMGIDFGTWEYNAGNNSIVLKSELDKDWNGERKIAVLTEKEMVLKVKEATLFYQKVNVAEIEASNKNSGLLGMWEFKDSPYPAANTFLTFSGPDEFKMIQKEEGLESRLSGTWIFDSQDMSLIMIGLRGEDMLSGESNVFKIDADHLELENNGKVFKAQKKVKSAQKIEHLTFTESDFYNEDGDYKYYDDEYKLPWYDWAEIKTGLLNVKQLVYNYSTLINGTEAFESKILRADVNATIEEEGFTIDNIFEGFDSYNLPEEAELPQDRDYAQSLYPLENSTFRVAGNEQITTPAGTFNCVVIETATFSDALKKLWVITDKPGFGIYARIIEEDPDPTFGHYAVYELQEIKKEIH